MAARFEALINDILELAETGAAPVPDKGVPFGEWSVRHSARDLWFQLLANRNDDPDRFADTIDTFFAAVLGIVIGVAPSRFSMIADPIANINSAASIAGAQRVARDLLTTYAQHERSIPGAALSHTLAIADRTNERVERTIAADAKSHRG